MQIRFLLYIDCLTLSTLLVPHPLPLPGLSTLHSPLPIANPNHCRTTSFLHLLFPLFSLSHSISHSHSHSLSLSLSHSLSLTLLAFGSFIRLLAKCLSCLGVCFYGSWGLSAILILAFVAVRKFWSAAVDIGDDCL
jgi:hypothetical protein